MATSKHRTDAKQMGPKGKPPECEVVLPASVEGATDGDNHTAPFAQPQKSVALRARDARYQAVADQLMAGVEAGSQMLAASLQQGAIKGRDLAVVVGIMIDKLGVLEERSGQRQNSNVQELEKRIALLMAAQQELERRRRDAQPLDVTPPKP